MKLIDADSLIEHAEVNCESSDFVEKLIDYVAEQEEVSISQGHENDLISRRKAIEARRYTFGNDEFSLEAAYHDCKLVFDEITDDDSFQEADTGLILYYANEIIYALQEALESSERTAESSQNVQDDDLISRKAAIDAIEEVDWYHQNNNKDMVHGANSSEDQAWYKADDIYKTLEALPSAQPERKKGEWKAKEEREKQEIFICSECGGWAYSPWIGSRKSPKPNRCKYAFCPNCGADMRGEE